MGTRVEREAFLKAWREAIAEAAPSRCPLRHAFWEGDKAFKELSGAKLLDRVMLREADRPHIAEHAIPDFCAEIAAYKKNLRKVTTVNQTFRDTDDLLKQQIGELTKRRKRVLISDIAQILADCVRHLEGARRLLRHQEEKRWFFPSGFVGAEYSKLATKRAPEQERELDGRFQVRLAIVFLKYLPVEDGHPSVRTIARLVVLFCYCAQLGTVQHGDRLILHHSQKDLSVRSVVKKLERAKLSKFWRN